jgi:PEP-CTERM/exosortase A-associated glycosyltransferase
MRILHILDHSIPLHSGYTFRTAAILREQRARGWETVHLTSPKQGPTAAAIEEVDGLRFHRCTCPAGGPKALSELRLIGALAKCLERLAGELQPDILHAHSPVLNAAAAILVGRRLGIPVVYEVRAFWEDAAVDHGTTSEGSLRYRLTRAFETWALRSADHVFTICQGLRGDIVARGIPAAKTTVIANAVDIGDFQPAGRPDAALAAQFGFAGKTVLGFAGSFYAYEGLDLLLEAFAILLARRSDLRLLLVGGGPQEARLRAQAERLSIADRVVFTGRVPHGEVGRYYSLIDLLIYPRRAMRLTELVTPLKPLEAMALGRVVVASDVGGHRELIRDGGNGRLFEAGKAGSLVAVVEELLDGREGWHALGTSARRYVECERTWPASVAGYEPVYRRLCPSAA